jgi:prolyl oligopeptidase
LACGQAAQRLDNRGTTYPQDTLLGTSLSQFIAGQREFRVLFEPGERRALQAFDWAGDRLLLSILDDLAPVFMMSDPSHDWLATRLEGLPPIAVAMVWPLDMEADESNGDLLAWTQDPLIPPTLILRQTGKTWEVLKRAPEAFSNEDLTISRHEAVSIDGERIPYTIAGPEKKLTGDAPVYMTAYGGLAVSMLPYYDAGLGKLWLERGGTCVTANIRGGGEFGTRWHTGRREGKRLSHDDFAAVAADLVARGVTRPGRIAARFRP